MAYIFSAGAVAGSWFGLQQEGWDALDGSFTSRRNDPGPFGESFGRPELVRWNGPERPIPDVINMPYLCISERFRALIEELEPDVHRVTPVDLCWEDRRVAEHRFFLHVGQSFDALSIQYSTGLDDKAWWFRPGEITDRLVVHALRRAGRHLWQNTGLQIGTAFMMSDELAQAAMRRGLTGLYLKQLPETDAGGRYEVPPPSRARVYRMDARWLEFGPKREFPLDGDEAEVLPLVPARVGRGHQVAASVGSRVTSKHLPTRIYFGARRPKPNDLSWAQPYNTISDRFRDLIEQLEPGVHQFAPVAYVGKKDRPIEQRWLLIVAQEVDGVSADRSTVLRTNDRWYNRGGEHGDLVFDAAKVGNLHLWRDLSVIDGPMFVSSALAEAITAAKLTGIHFTAYERP